MLCIQRIRDIFVNVLYEFTFCLLTYLLTLHICRLFEWEYIYLFTYLLNYILYCIILYYIILYYIRYLGLLVFSRLHQI